jgi:hypothetical protein
MDLEWESNGPSACMDGQDPNEGIQHSLTHSLTHSHSLTHGAEPFLRSCPLCSYSGTYQHYMEPEGSLPYSQKPSTSPYSEPDESNSYQPILSLYDLF